jgi:uncharacterized membrane protein
MDFYPLSVDEAVLISATLKKDVGLSSELVSEVTQTMTGEGWVETFKVRAPFSNATTSRFKITPAGIDRLNPWTLGARDDEGGDLAGLETRLVETYHHIRSRMTTCRQDLTNDIGKLDNRLEELEITVAAQTQELLALKLQVRELTERLEDERLEEERIVLKVLSGDERGVYEAITKTGGTMMQKELVAITKMSNAKVSRIVDRLESRGILVKERKGATNRLRLVVRLPN